MRDLEQALSRWKSAGVVDDATAERIIAYERAHLPAKESESRLSWQVLIALIFGAILLAAGVLLFVAAHWEQISPFSRFALVLAMVAFFHLGGLLARPRFDGLAIALHAVGTVATGAAIALTGQIFNINEHWPAAILLWAIAAACGWWLLRDQVQQTLTLLLVPSWIFCEFESRFGSYHGGDVYLLRCMAIIAALYLAGWVHSSKKVVFGILFAFAAVDLIVSCIQLGETGWGGYGSGESFIPLQGRIIFWTITALVFVAARFINRSSLLPVAVITAVTVLLPYAHAVHSFSNTFGNDQTYSYSSTTPNAFFYLLLGVTSAFFAWWGVRHSSKALINYGIICFALTVMYFYFSDLLDKLDRSLGLMLGGVLFLAGGWLLEKMRRRLVGSISATEAQL